MNTVRWNIAVSPDVDQSVRMFIAAQGGGRKGDLSRFIEETRRCSGRVSTDAGSPRHQCAIGRSDLVAQCPRHHLPCLACGKF